MKKALGGNLCAYCGERPATTEDHVIGRNFFPVHLRSNLPKVPACSDCNGRKSNYERYAMAVFPFGSEHHAAQDILRTKVKLRLEKDQRLLRQLQQSQKDVTVVNPDGSTDTTIAIRLDDEQTLNLFGMIIRGLLWHHCRSPLPSSYVVRLFSLTDQGLGLFKKLVLSLSPDQFQDGSLANGAFWYQFTRNPDDSFFTAWILDIYGTLNMCDIGDNGRLHRSHVAALTGPQEINRIADAIEAMM
jgi:hypothetical protein